MNFKKFNCIIKTALLLLLICGQFVFSKVNARELVKNYLVLTPEHIDNERYRGADIFERRNRLDMDNYINNPLKEKAEQLAEKIQNYARKQQVEKFQKEGVKLIRDFHMTEAAAATALKMAKLEWLIGDYQRAADFLTYIVNCHYYSEHFDEAAYLLAAYMLQNFHRRELEDIYEFFTEEKSLSPYYPEIVKLMAAMYRNDLEQYQKEQDQRNIEKTRTRLKTLAKKKMDIDFTVNWKFNYEESKGLQTPDFHLIITTTLNKGEEIIKKHVSEAETTVAIPVLGDSKILCKGRSGFQGGQGFIDNESIITEYRKNAGYNHQINMYLARYVSLKFSAHDAESKKPVPAQFIISSYINNKLVSEDHIEKTAPHNSIMVPVAGTSYLIAKAADHFPGMLKITADRKDEHKTNIIHVKKLTAAQENIVLIPNINFISNNTSLTRPAQLFMETLGELLQKAGLQKLELRGYCNKSENEEYNNQIALQKADTVKAVLQTIMKNAVIETDGFGSKLPETSRDQDPAAVIGIKTTTK